MAASSKWNSQTLHGELGAKQSLAMISALTRFVPGSAPGRQKNLANMTWQFAPPTKRATCSPTKASGTPAAISGIKSSARKLPWENRHDQRWKKAAHIFRIADWRVRPCRRGHLRGPSDWLLHIVESRQCRAARSSASANQRRL